MDILNTWQVLSEVWLEIMWQITWQSSLFALIILLLDKTILRRAQANLRYSVWLLALLKFIVLPSISVPCGWGSWGPDIWNKVCPPAPNLAKVPNLRKVTERWNGIRLSTPIESEIATSVMPSHAGLDVSSAAVPTEPQPESEVRIPSILAAIWTAGIAILLSLALRRYVRLPSSIASATAFKGGSVPNIVEDCAQELGLRRTPIVRISERNCGPIVYGIWNPIILLTKSLIESFNSDELKSVICHELAHIRRFDLLINWLQVFVQIVFFFNPFVWYVNRRLRAERERACDDWVLTIVEERKMYARSLVKTAELTDSDCVYAAGVVEPRGAIADRIRKIMDSERTIKTSLSWKAIVFLVLIALVCLPAMSRAQVEKDDDAAKTTQENEAEKKEQESRTIAVEQRNKEDDVEKQSKTTELPAAEGQNLRHKIEDLLQQSIENLQRAKYDKAIERAKIILEIDPNNEPAKTLVKTIDRRVGLMEEIGSTLSVSLAGKMARRMLQQLEKYEDQEALREILQSKKKSTDNRIAVEVRVTKGGNIVLNGTTLNESQLSLTLMIQTRLFPDQRVIINGDPTAHYKDVAKLIGTCQRAGVNNISFKQEGEEKKAEAGKKEMRIAPDSAQVKNTSKESEALIERGEYSDSDIVDKRIREAESKKEEKLAQRLAEGEKMLERLMHQQRAAKTEALFEQAVKEYQRGRYDEAITMAENILKIAPNNGPAQTLIESATKDKVKHRQKELDQRDETLPPEQQAEKETQKALEEALEKKVSFNFDNTALSDAFRSPAEQVDAKKGSQYPDAATWRKIAQKGPVKLASRNLIKNEVTLEEAVQKEIRFDFKNTPLLKAIGILCKKANIKWWLSPDIVDTLKQTSVTASSEEGIPLRDALERVLPGRFTYEVTQDSIRVRKVLLIFRAYDVRDLLLELIPVEKGKGKGRFAEQGMRKRAAALITTVIRETGPQHWKSATIYGDSAEIGEIKEQLSGEGTIGFKDGDLLVENTERVHEQVEKMINEWREKRYIQVGIESDVFEVTDAFIDDMCLWRPELQAFFGRKQFWTFDQPTPNTPYTFLNDNVAKSFLNKAVSNKEVKATSMNVTLFSGSRTAASVGNKVRLDIQPTVSADRKYVSVKFFSPIENTTCFIPDKGTLLIRCPKQGAAQKDKHEGAGPAKSKNGELLLLIKPTILMAKELQKTNPGPRVLR